jgi:DNA-binding response OmpR family regulator
VKLRPKSFEVLRLLIERHGQLVTKDDLLDAVWGRTVVTEGSIVQCLIDVLEEEDSKDVDYFIDLDTVDILEDNGASLRRCSSLQARERAGSVLSAMQRRRG